MNIRINYNLYLIFCFLGTFALSCKAQVETDRAACINEAFDQKVERTIKFTVPTIDPDGLKSMGENVYILDARELEEYEVSHIPKAKFIGYKDFDADMLPQMSKDDKIVIYCTIGYRSEKIGEKLEEIGYENVYNLYGLSLIHI